ncbi:hypothetical protein GGF46_003654 [Coemansia sp. RSA 552]|nr:hypothetical protein GGF46_003654 [Coemansia sp. RSA 552]
MNWRVCNVPKPEPQPPMCCGHMHCQHSGVHHGHHWPAHCCPKKEEKEAPAGLPPGAAEIIGKAIGTPGTHEFVFTKEVAQPKSEWEQYVENLTAYLKENNIYHAELNPNPHGHQHPPPPPHHHHHHHHPHMHGWGCH